MSLNDPRKSTGLYYGLLDENKIRAFLLQYDAGLIQDPFLRLAAQEIKSLREEVERLNRQVGKLRKKVGGNTTTPLDPNAGTGLDGGDNSGTGDKGGSDGTVGFG